MSTQDNHFQGTSRPADALYIVTLEDVDSYNGRSRPLSYHWTLESAMDALPDDIKANLAKYERPALGKNQVRHFCYNTIEKHELQGVSMAAYLTDADKGRIVNEVHAWLEVNTGEDWSRMGTLAQLKNYGLGLVNGFRTWGR